jgi:hypothetical protein
MNIPRIISGTIRAKNPKITPIIPRIRHEVFVSNIQSPR